MPRDSPRLGVADRKAATRLIAIEGADSDEVADAAADFRNRLTARQQRALISRWDASALFTDVAAAPVAQRDVSPRTLMLLYAADLAFRLRWDILPALDQGHVVIAAPYVATAVAFGVATGLPAEWLRTLFRFAPVPLSTVVLREPKGRVWKRRPERGLGDCCTALLSATSDGFARRKTRTAMVRHLKAAADDDVGVYRKRDRREILEQIVKLGDRQAAPAQTRPRAR
jgi:thymidylate kinase